MSDVHPEFPLICEREGNPYKWVDMRPTGDSLVVPRIEHKGELFLFTCKGRCYDILLIDNSKTTLFDMRTLPFTHWFTKPISISCRCSNHDKPIIMDDCVDYLVEIQGRLNFISTETLLRDALPISTWYDDKDLFPIR